jgi:hypothetical protein
VPKKFVQRYLKPTLFKSKGHWMEGVIWPIKGSKDNEYNVTLHPGGFTCDCPGFNFRGRCKHSEQVLQRVERAMNDRLPQYA